MTEQLHRHGKRRVIGLVLAGCVLIGGLGAVAGEVFDKEPAKPVVSQPGDGAVLQPSGPGRSVATRGLLPLDSDTFDPHAVGDIYDLGDGANVWVPDGWSVYRTADTRVWEMNGKGSFAFAALGHYQSADVKAGDVIQQNLDGLLPPDIYTQREITGPRDWGEPFGDIVSVSILDYQALWTDPQGSAAIYGQIYAGVRKDGAVLVVLIEHVPPDDWNATAYPRADIPTQSFIRFAGLV